MKTFSIPSDELLQLWKLHHGYGPMRNDCVVSRTDGPDLDALIMEKIRAWYVKMLTDMPKEYLPVTEISTQLTLSPLEGGAWSRLPDNCMRIIDVTAANWTVPAVIVTDLTHPDALAQTNPFARAGSDRPVVIKGTDSISFFPAPVPDSDFSVKAVIIPDVDADSYLFTPVLYSQIPFID